MSRQKGRRVMSGIVSQREDIFTSVEHGKCVSMVKRVKFLHVPLSAARPQCFRSPLAASKSVIHFLWEFSRLQNIDHFNTLF